MPITAWLFKFTPITHVKKKKEITKFKSVIHAVLMENNSNFGASKSI